jgi:ADP-ribose pyrophosphatase YjhB (NUDIX family)
MQNASNPLTQKEFDSIYSKVPRLTVEIIIKSSEGKIYLTKRAIEPCKGQWHLPGGTVRFGEPMKDAVQRIALRELGVSVTESKSVDNIEYPSHYNHGLDSPVGIVFEVQSYDGELVINNESAESGWYSSIPANMHADQDVFLIKNGYLAQA